MTARARIGRIARMCRHRLEACLFVAAIGVVRLIPVDAASNLGGRIARVVGPRLPASRRATRNLALVLPETGEAERRRIVAGMWENLGRVFFEYPHLGAITEPDSGRVERIGEEILEDLRARGQPCILASGHLANWEVLPIAGGRLGYEMDSIVREPNNPFVRRALERLREVGGGKRIPKGAEGAREAVKVLRRGGMLALLFDQKLSDGVPVDFFGRKAMTAPAIGQLAIRFRCPVVPIRIERTGPARFRITCFPPLAPRAKAEKEAEVVRLLEELNRMLETWIRDRPAEWLWLHRRWPDS